MITVQELQTRERLLQAAGQVFAEKGYVAATGKEICGRAGTNLAAINYHFGGKEALYEETLARAHRGVISLEDLKARIPKSASPEQKLEIFVGALVHGLLSPDPSAWYSRLLAREMVAPSAALDAVIEKEILPKSRFFRGIVGEIMGLPPTHPAVQLGTTSVICQALFLFQNRSVLERVFDRLPYDPARHEELVQHIVQFSLAGLRAAAKAARPRSRA